MKIESLDQIALSRELWEQYTELDNFNELTLQQRIDFLDVLFYYESDI
jgi:hypothetical protein